MTGFRSGGYNAALAMPTKQIPPETRGRLWHRVPAQPRKPKTYAPPYFPKIQVSWRDVEPCRASPVQANSFNIIMLSENWAPIS